MFEETFYQDLFEILSEKENKPNQVSKADAELLAELSRFWLGLNDEETKGEAA